MVRCVAAACERPTISEHVRAAESREHELAFTMNAKVPEQRSPWTVKNPMI